VIRRAGALVVALGVATLLAPDAALAHGLVGVGGLPIPKFMFAWAAAVVLVASFVGLGALWSSPRLQHPRERRVLRLPPALDTLAGIVGVGIFAVVIYAGLAGEQTNPTANLAPTAIFVTLWVGVPCMSALFGDVFRPLNPWRAIGRAAGWGWNRLGRPVDNAASPYPERLGRWPAVLGIAGFAWLELVYAHHDDPRRLALLAIAYATLQLAGMSRYGVDAWTEHGDGLGVYFGLCARLSPLRWVGGELRVRRPLEGIAGLTTPPGDRKSVV